MNSIDTCGRYAAERRADMMRERQRDRCIAAAGSMKQMADRPAIGMFRRFRGQVAILHRFMWSLPR